MTFKKNNDYRLSLYALLCVAIFSLGFQSVAHAQSNDAPTGLMPAQNMIDVDTMIEDGIETHPPLRLTPDKSEIVNIGEEIERVIIGNDRHVNIFLDTSSRMIVVPRIPGATHFTLMGRDGKIVMRRHVIVASPKKDYIRIRQSCGMTTEECESTKVYYCPGMCHEIMVQDGTAPTTTGLAPAPVGTSMPPTTFDDGNN